MKNTERRAADDKADVYAIPANYKIPYMIFGRFPLRNTLEGGVVSFIVYQIIFNLVKVRIDSPAKVLGILVALFLPAIAGIIGYRGEPLSKFFISLFEFRFTKRKMPYKRMKKSPEVLEREAELREIGGAKNEAFDDEENLSKKELKKKLKKEKKKKKKELLKNPNGTEKAGVVKQAMGLLNIDGSNSEEFVQDFIGIKRIRDGIIQTDDFRYVKIIEIEPINFLLRSARERNHIIRSFSRVLRVAPETLQFKTITKKVDSERHIELLKKEMSAETNSKTREMTKAYIDLVRDSGQEALTRRFFIIFQYEEEGRGGGTPAYTQVVSQLSSNAKSIADYMRKAGNPVVTYKSLAEENKALNEFLYEFFNKRSSIEDPFARRYRKVFNDTMIAKGRDPKQSRNVQDIPDSDFIAPRGIDLSKFDHVVMDGTYYSFLMLPSNGYRNQVIAGWTSQFVNLGDGIDVDIHLKKIPRERAQNSVSIHLRNTLGRSFGKSETSDDAYEIADSINSSRYFTQALRAGQDFFYMTTIITISSPQLSTLKSKVDQVKRLMNSHDYKTVAFPFQHERALRSVMPLCKLDSSLYSLGRRNVTTDGAASSYTFTSFEMSDENGILIGVNNANKSLCIVDIFNRKVYQNANIAILGRSGAGKTYLEQLIALRMRMRGIQVFIIAPDKGHEYKHACESIGGTYVNISASSSHCINIMEIRPTDASEEALADMGAEDMSQLAKKAEQIKIFFSLLVRRELDVQEESILDTAVMNTYKELGITNDNKTLVLPGQEEEAKPEFKQMPILQDLYRNLIKIGDENEYFKSYTQSLSLSMSRYVEGGSMSAFNKQTNVDLNNKYVVLDITNLSEDMLPIGMFIVLEYCWDKIREDRSQRKAIFIDETWQLISVNEESAKFVFEIFKTIRAYGGSAIAATQDLDDFYALEDGKYGKAIVNNSQTKIILGLERTGAETVRDIVGLTDTEYDQVQSFETGQALFLSNSNKIQLDILGSQVEHDLITTDREDITRKLEEKGRDRKKAEKEALRKSTPVIEDITDED